MVSAKEPELFFFILSFSTRDLVSKADELNQKVVDSELMDDLSEEAQQVADSVTNADVLKKIELNPALFNLDEEQKAQVDSIVNSKIPSTGPSMEADENLSDSIKVSKLNAKGVPWSFDKKMIDSLIVPVI